MKNLPTPIALRCLTAGSVLSQSNSDPPSDYLAPRKILFETGPEVHHVVVFDTIARVDPNEVNYRILYDEEHTPDQGVISFRAPPTFFVIGFDLNNRPVTNLQIVHNHVPFPIHLLPPPKLPPL